MKITTNNHWRQFKYRYEVPTEILEDQFDWTNEDDHSDGFFEYRGWWYHLDDFIRSNDPAFDGWNGILTDSYFSGVLIKLSDNCEEYQVATVTS